HGSSVTALLYGNSSNITLNLQTISPSNVTGKILMKWHGNMNLYLDWILTSEPIAKTTVQVKLRLNRSLRLCGNNETDTDCCVNPLCVLETLQVSACEGNTSQASLVIQVKVYALLVSDNKTIIQNQVYRPLGECPCDLTFNTCDLWCCCDKDCSVEDLRLFKYSCLPGPFGGQFPDPEYQCSVQSTQNSPDWFPFLCVTSPSENNPYLGLFYEASKPGVSFGDSISSAPKQSNAYIEGSPILTINDQYFTIPRVSYFEISGNGNTLNGHCVINAPVAFLKNFDVRCVTLLQACPTESPLHTTPEDLRAVVKNVVRPFFICNDTHGSVQSVNASFVFLKVSLTTRYSAKFLSGDIMTEPNSGNPGYQVGRPVIGGILNTSMGNDTMFVLVNSGLCSTADMRPVLFGENSTSGCLLPNAIIFTHFYLLKSLRQSIFFLIFSDVTLNSSGVEDSNSSCTDIPSNLHIYVWTLVTGFVHGIPQKDVKAVQIRCAQVLNQYILFRNHNLYQINFTEYDCNRNDVCWPELAFPITRFYTGEPYSQALAKGLILVFFFVVASVLGTPWRQIWQIWNTI
uniref:Uncharacterized protein n=1 Tax=Periophthalmus magnuspinnatus TaxID=409849 RepID=A0A3B4AIZ1_9GOBI